MITIIKKAPDGSLGTITDLINDFVDFELLITSTVSNYLHRLLDADRAPV